MARLKIITRRTAKAAGLTRFYTGVPCMRGHTAERRVSNRQCVICARAYYLRYRATEPIKKLRSGLITQLGGKCECCLESEYTFLCIDHRKGGGNQHRKQFRSSPAFLYWLQREIRAKGIYAVKKDFRILCCNCNQAYHFLGYCPHQLMEQGQEAAE